MRTQMQRPRPIDDDDQPDPVTVRDIVALLLGLPGAVLTFVMAVLVVAAMPWQGGLLLTGAALTGVGVLLGTRRA